MKELLLTINVKCLEPLYVKGKNSAVNMVPFTGSASGKIFEGIVLPYACDTQRFEEGKDANLSARYMLEGCEHLRRTEVKVDDQNFSDPFIGKSDGTDINTISLDELVKQYL